MTDMNSVLVKAGLNRSQRRFCKISSDHNVRLLAPAGSGKTFSLLWRCRYILDDYKKRGIPNPYFLIVTFTRTAKLELESRINLCPDFQDISATVCTLNAWGWEQLKSKTGRELAVSSFQRKNLVNHDLMPLCRKYERVYGLIKQPRGQAVNAPLIIDTIDALKSLGFTHLMKKSDYNAHIKFLKEIGLFTLFRDTMDNLLRSEKVNLDNDTEKHEAEFEFFKFWKDAVVQLEAINRYTMEDQKYWARINLENKIAESKYAHSNRFTHIFIDEFQDINPLDLDLIKAISLYHGNGKPIKITIAGDDDQAIFGWRGTTPKFILDPERYFEVEFDTAVLDTNYRSPSAIVDLSSKLIRYNKNRVQKQMKSEAKGRAYIKIDHRKTALTSTEAAIKLAHKLISEKGCKNVAFISRRQAELFPYQVLLSAENTLYNVAADIDIFEGEAMQSLQTIIQIIYRAKADDNDDPVSDLLFICDKIERYQLQSKEKQALHLYLDKKSINSFPEAIEALSQFGGTIKNMPVFHYCDIVQALYESKTVYEFMRILIDEFKGFEQDYTKADKDNHYKNPQFLLLKDLSVKYGTDLRSFYKDIDKARRSGEISRRRIADESENSYLENQKVSFHLVTATRSKGSEFDAVIIVDCVDSLWPAALSTDMEEERRLFYVAMTRAKKYLYFSTYGNTCSRFLLEAGLTPD